MTQSTFRAPDEHAREYAERERARNEVAVEFVSRYPKGGEQLTEDFITTMMRRLDMERALKSVIEEEGMYAELVRRGVSFEALQIATEKAHKRDETYHGIVSPSRKILAFNPFAKLDKK